MRDIKGALGKAWSFPPAFSLEEGVSMSVDYQRIQESLKILFSTLPGERIMRESFGCDLHQFVFENIGDELISRITRTIEEAVGNEEPRVEILTLNAVQNDLKPYQLDVQVIYRIKGSQDILNLDGQINLNTTNHWGNTWVS
ncbi:TPA: GPW/gp25 family protein [Enterobacter bugandensis]|nr:GPW/gp25 family protein [Enterobacter bugandensis]